MASRGAIIRSAASIPVGQKGGSTAGVLSPLSQSLASGGVTWGQAYSGSLPRPATEFVQGAFGPFSPIEPMPIDAPEPGSGQVEPRTHQYRVGWNLPVGEPGTEGIKLADFSTLRSLADLYSVARAAIQLRKSELRGLEWDIMPTRDAAKAMRGDKAAMKDFGERRAKAVHFFRRPDPDYFSWNTWFDALNEEVLVYDALSLLLRPKWGKGMRKGLLGSDLDSLQLIHGPSIRPLYDLHGATPRPPAPAYQQYLYGVPRTDLMTMISQRDIDDAGMAGSGLGKYAGNQLLYLPMVPRRWTPYGFPPIERALVPVMSGLQKQGYQLDYFKEGTVPAVYISPGDSNNLTPAQVQELQDALNAIAGDPAWKHKIIVLPSGSKVDPMRSPQLADQFDEIVMNQVCMAFDVQPMELGISPRVSTTQSPGASNQMAKMASSTQKRVATKPYLKFVSDIFDSILVNVCHQDDMRFVFEGLEENEDETELTTRLVQQVNNMLVSPDEAREELGKQPWGLPDTSDPGFMTATGWTPITKSGVPVAPPSGPSGESGAESGALGGDGSGKPSGGGGARPDGSGSAPKRPSGSSGVSGNNGQSPGHDLAEASDTESGRASGKSGAAKAATPTAPESGTAPETSDVATEPEPTGSETGTEQVAEALVAAELVRLMTELFGRHISLAGAVDRSVSALASAYLHAMTRGAQRAASRFHGTPMPDFSGDAAARAEHQRYYLVGMAKKAAESAQNGGDLSWLQARANLYAQSLHAASESGFGQMIKAAEPDAEVIWRLGETEHCPLCLARKDKRYTFDELPGWPGDGGFGELCMGGANCGCSLDLVENGEITDHADNGIRPWSVPYHRQQLEDITARRIRQGDARGHFVMELPTTTDVIGTSAQSRAMNRDELRSTLASLLNQRIRSAGGYPGVSVEPSDVPAAIIARLIPPYGENTTPTYTQVMDAVDELYAGKSARLDMTRDEFRGIVVASLIDVAKVGPKGYIHGWIKVGAGSDGVLNNLDAIHNRHPGIRIDLTPHGDKNVTLSLIRTDESARGQGKADKALDDLLHVADHHGVTVSLTPEPLAGDTKTKKAKLTAWYKSKGFVPNKGRNKDYAVSDTMLRPLQSCEAGKSWAPEHKVRAELEALGRHVRKGRDPRTWTPELIDAADIATVAELIKGGSKPADAASEALRRRVSLAGEVVWQPAEPTDSGMLAAGGGAMPPVPHDADGIPVSDKSWKHPDPTQNPADAVRDQLAKDFPSDSLDWVTGTVWTGPGYVSLGDVDTSNRSSWKANHEPEKVTAFRDRIERRQDEGKAAPIKPVILVKTPDNSRMIVVDGHHRTLAFEKLGSPVYAYVGHVDSETGPWDELHALQRTSDASKGEGHGDAQTLRDYWTGHGHGGPTHGAFEKEIAWGTPGDFDRCVSMVAEHGKMNPDQAKGYCNLRHHEALGYWPAQHAERDRGKSAEDPELTKVGPKGYIHGWIFVGVPGVGEHVYVPGKGHGTVVHIDHGTGTSHVQFHKTGNVHTFDISHSPGPWPNKPGIRPRDDVHEITGTHHVPTMPAEHGHIEPAHVVPDAHAEPGHAKPVHAGQPEHVETESELKPEPPAETSTHDLAQHALSALSSLSSDLSAYQHTVAGNLARKYTDSALKYLQQGDTQSARALANLARKRVHSLVEIGHTAGIDDETGNDLYTRAEHVADVVAQLHEANLAGTLNPDDLKLSHVEPETEHATEPAVSTHDRFDPVDISGWTKVSDAKGSNPGGVYRDADGVEHYVKQTKTPDHARNEALAAELYKLTGVKTADVHLADTGSGLGVESPMINGATSDLASRIADPAYRAKVVDGFATDAWLGNWDTVGLGMDNIVTDKGGDPVRVDLGGSMLYRAQGTPKGDAFDDKASEWDSLRDPSVNPQSAKVFGDATSEQLRASAQHVVDVTPAQIDDAVDRAGFDQATGDALKTRLKARREAIAKQAGVSLPESPSTGAAKPGKAKGPIASLESNPLGNKADQDAFVSGVNGVRDVLNPLDPSLAEQLPTEAEMREDFDKKLSLPTLLKLHNAKVWAGKALANEQSWGDWADPAVTSALHGVQSKLDGHIQALQAAHNAYAKASNQLHAVNQLADEVATLPNSVSLPSLKYRISKAQSAILKGDLNGAAGATETVRDRLQGMVLSTHPSSVDKSRLEHLVSEASRIHDEVKKLRDAKDVKDAENAVSAPLKYTKDGYHEPDYTSKEKKAIENYTGPYSGKLNHLLKHDPDQLSLKENLKYRQVRDGLDSAFTKATGPKDATITYRGVKHHIGQQLFGVTPGERVGKVYSEGAFASTSRSKSLARSFAASGYHGVASGSTETAGSPYGKTLITYRIPYGSQALDVKPHSYYPHEEETLLHRKNRYRILSDKLSPDGDRLVEVAVLPPTTPSEATS